MTTTSAALQTWHREPEPGSLRSIIVQNPRLRLYTNPLEWTTDHLERLSYQLHVLTPDNEDSEEVPQPYTHHWAEALAAANSTRRCRKKHNRDEDMRLVVQRLSLEAGLKSTTISIRYNKHSVASILLPFLFHKVPGSPSWAYLDEDWTADRRHERNDIHKRPFRCGARFIEQIRGCPIDPLYIAVLIALAQDNARRNSKKTRYTVCLFVPEHSKTILDPTDEQNKWADPWATRLIQYSAVISKEYLQKGLSQPISSAMARNYPKDEPQFERVFKQNKQHTLQSRGIQNSSGSKWGLDELEAFRVVLDTGSSHLRKLRDYAQDVNNMLAQSPDELAALMKLSLPQIQKLDHKQLRKEGGAYSGFYVALSDITRAPEPTNNAPNRPARNVKPPNRRDYDPGVGFSSPHGPSSAGSVVPSEGSVFSPKYEGPVEYDEQLDRVMNEDLALDFVSQFISTTIDCLSVQTPKDFSIEHFRANTKFTLKPSSKVDCVSVDDGAIIRRKVGSTIREWTSERSLLCSIEAKARYRKADANDQGVPDDKVLAQQVSELLGGLMFKVRRRAYEDLLDHERCRFLISAHQTHISFLHTDFSENYLEYLYSDNQPEVLPFLEIQRTKEFDLMDINEHLAAAKELLRMVKYFDKAYENL
ncbi:hypothetical protein G7Y89_g8944 [Cudoniella acicularis]|uniref:Uncharacterized protein n=1 Tax=Cudoniella acicularis TaxID=354080 RepID=A0A8H4RFM0_9HELO|nr:hypothetical protein G7Y89_g8944 [Cudoniella acicularis]